MNSLLDTLCHVLHSPNTNFYIQSEDVSSFGRRNITIGIHLETFKWYDLCDLFALILFWCCAIFVKRASRKALFIGFGVLIGGTLGISMCCAISLWEEKLSKYVRLMINPCIELLFIGITIILKTRLAITVTHKWMDLLRHVGIHIIYSLLLCIPFLLFPKIHPCDGIYFFTLCSYFIYANFALAAYTCLVYAIHNDCFLIYNRRLEVVANMRRQFGWDIIKKRRAPKTSRVVDQHPLVLPRNN